MSALAPRFDPLIAEAKLRMRRRRVLMGALVLLAAAGVLFLIIRPSGSAPVTSRVTSHGGNGNGASLAQLKVSVDRNERTWRAGIRAMERSAQCACGLTVAGERRLERKVIRVVNRTGATIVRMKIWPRFGEVEVVLATRVNPGQYLGYRARRLVSLLGRDYPYINVVNARGSSIFEWYRLPRQGGVGIPKR